ncbi:hypothetical protein [Clostridium tarantellae]|uniref:Uncharacterized protein n=1 Tax=Clostridium tarantellae TaxID=39493 RepID=A0A6I1MT69_9CLOT|nr:hypothetical protein [Clostridium tarantellae]MPQ43429.1 hypothetical protein [Clostridium tarantellae]
MDLSYKVKVEEIVNEWAPVIMDELKYSLEDNGKDTNMLLECTVIVSDGMEYCRDTDREILGWYKLGRYGTENKIELFWRNFRDLSSGPDKLAIIHTLAHEYRHCYQTEYYSFEEMDSIGYREAREADANNFANLIRMLAQDK